MATIWKYPITISSGQHSLQVPEGAIPLSTQA